MAPKKAPTPFTVDDVQCTVKDGLINAGLNDGCPRELRFPAKVKPTASLDEAKSKVRRHEKFAALAAWATGGAHDDAHERSRSPRADRAHGNVSIKIGTRELESLRELNAAADGPAMQIGTAAQQPADAQQPAHPAQGARPKKARDSCDFCMRLGRTFPGVQPACEPEDGIEVVNCRCAVTCSRQSPTWSEPIGRYQAYAEFAAGIGCRCRCCQRHFDEEVCLFHDGDLHREGWERETLRAALAAAGNPACRLREVLALCDACEGSCGIELNHVTRAFCGEAVAVVRTVLLEVIDEACADAGGGSE